MNVCRVRDEGFSGTGIGTGNASKHLCFWCETFKLVAFTLYRRTEVGFDFNLKLHSVANPAKQWKEFYSLSHEMAKPYGGQ